MVFSLKKLLFLSLFLAVFVPFASAEATYVYVEEDGTELEAVGARLGDAPLRVLDAGTRLQIMGDTRGFRLQVKLDDGTVGQIKKRFVTDEPPQGTQPDQGEQDLGALIKDERSSAELNTAISGRGLSEAAKDMAKITEISEDAIAQIETMELRTAEITIEEVEKFAVEGELLK